MQLPLHPFSVGDVPGDFRRADDGTGGVADRRHGERYVDERAVLSLADGVEVFDTLAAPDARQHHVFFAQTLGWNQDRD